MGSSRVVDTRYNIESISRVRRCVDHDCDLVFKTLESVTDDFEADVMHNYKNVYLDSTVTTTRNYGKFITRKRLFEVGPLKLSFDTAEKVVDE